MNPVKENNNNLLIVATFALYSIWQLAYNSLNPYKKENKGVVFTVTGKRNIDDFMLFLLDSAPNFRSQNLPAFLNLQATITVSPGLVQVASP